LSNVGSGNDRASRQKLLADAGRNARIVEVDLEAEIALLLRRIAPSGRAGSSSVIVLPFLKAKA
jgi:hypothetical protein